MCCNDGTKKINCPERRRDFRQPVSVTTIKDYDKVENITWYKPQAYPYYANSRSYVLPYIGTVTVESKESIETAAEAYNELSDEEKDLVTEYEHLQAARKEYRECLLDALENDDLLSQVEATVSATMSNYSPKFTLNREERVLYFEVTSDQDSTDAVLFYPGLSYAFFSVLENNMCDISSQIYEVTQQYEVDSVVIMHG